MFDSDSTDKLTAPIPAVGFSPNAGGEFSQENYHHPAAGWGAAKSVGMELLRQGELIDGTARRFQDEPRERRFSDPSERKQSRKNRRVCLFPAALSEESELVMFHREIRPLKPMVSAIWNVENTRRSICFQGSGASFTVSALRGCCRGLPRKRLSA